MPVDAPLYPVSLLVAGRHCLVVGGGAVAARKVGGLLDAGAVVHVVARRVGPEVRALGASWEERDFAAEDLGGARLAFAATDDPAVNAAVLAAGEAAGVWVNAADDPANCSFTLPAVVRRGPVTVAVSTAGHSPALAGWLARQVADRLGPEHEVLAELLSQQREEVRAAGRSTEGLDWQSALNSDMLDLIRAGKVQQAKERLEACLSSSSV
ncbi:MAG TPA: bifunctional precorrin-2 dehydrogenase/sirohydrochlorin ferrochelatase [Acidimicrobiales bacterium]|nr:bifunctional precorrin-2 dehydrogenase/sirohydrochlorin ferrochelatase [Acidimicrobiales bacterium]